MSQKGEKYARTMERRVDKLEGEILALRRDQREDDRFCQILCAVSDKRAEAGEKAAEAARRRARAEAARSRRWRAAAWFLAVCMAAVVLAWVLSTPAESREETHTVETVDKPMAVQVLEPEGTISTEELAGRVQVLEDCRITYYCPCVQCCGQWADGITASGEPFRPWETLAVDPEVIPLGSRVCLLWEDGRELWCRAVDTGVTGNHVDLGVRSHEEALSLGVGTVTVYWEKSNGRE